MDKISGLMFKSFAAKTNVARHVQANMVCEFVNGKIAEFWGKKGGEQAKAISLKSNVLTFHCANPVMAQELRFKQGKFMEEVNKKYGERTVKKVKIVQKGLDQVMEV
jgi:hypothetical protein